MEYMKNHLITFGAVCLALVLTGCANTEMTKTEEAKPKAASSADPTQKDYEKALTNAKAEIKKAAAVGSEWRDTGALIKKAEAAAASGDYATATKLADRARFEAEMGQKQAAEQVGVGNPGYLTSK